MFEIAEKRLPNAAGNLRLAMRRTKALALAGACPFRKPTRQCEAIDGREQTVSYNEQQMAEVEARKQRSIAQLRAEGYLCRLVTTD